MDYTVKNVGVRQFRRRNKKTNVVEVVTVSNRNGLPVEEQLRLLNLNDKENEYSLPDSDSPASAGGSDTVDITLPS